MASRFPFRSSLHLDSARSENKTSSISSFYSKYSKYSTKNQQNPSSSTNNPLSISSSRNISLSCCSSKSLSSIPSSDRDDSILEDEHSLGITTHTNEFEFNHVNCLLWVLHQSARSFSLAIQSPKFTNAPELSNAWNGIDVNAWHKHTAYQVAVYALFKTAIEAELFLSQKRISSTPVYETLSSNTLFLGEFIETQLNSKQPELVHWFKTVQLPRIAGLFIPLLKKWSLEYSSSGIAGVILAITCCTAVKNLGSDRIACPQFLASIDDSLIDLRDLSRDLVSMDEVHNLAIEAGFEDDFLSHFGKKVLPSKNIEDVEFWIGLVKKKLCLAFHRESVIKNNENYIDKVEETSLATLGIFAYLGRETRLYLSHMNIKEMDDQITDFLSYLECGSLYIYPEFNSLPKYQLFIEVVIDEIGWLDFYAPLKCKFRDDGRRSIIQPEKEIILYTVLTLCNDVFSGFLQYTSSSQKPLDSDVLSFLFRSQTLLSNCLEDYWAAHDNKSSDVMQFAERVAPDSSILLEAHSKPIELMKRGNHQEVAREVKVTSLTGINRVKVVGKEYGAKQKRLHERLLRESTQKLISASNIILMGTRLLFVDVADVIGLLVKQLSGKKITKREKRKIKRTLNDLVTLVPITILMLIPVSAVGHAAILAAINKYVPSLIPSPYSSERLNLVRQLKRTKKMEVESWAIRETSKDSEGDQSFTVVIP